MHSIVLIREKNHFAVTGVAAQAAATAASAERDVAWTAAGRSRVYGARDASGRPWFAVNDFGVIGCALHSPGGNRPLETPLDRLSLGVLTEILGGLLAEREFRAIALFLADRFTGYTIRWNAEGQMTTTTNPGRLLLVANQPDPAAPELLSASGEAFTAWAAAGRPMEAHLPAFVRHAAARSAATTGLPQTLAQCATDFQRHTAELRIWHGAEALNAMPCTRFTVPLRRVY